MASFVSLKTLVLTVGLALALATDAAAQKTDVIVLRNGDRITGEIKGLVRGKLEVSTDNLSTVLITWVEVVELRTKRMFVVELITGERTFGTLESHRSGEVDIVGLETRTAALSTIVELHELRPTLLGRIDGNIQAGLYIARSNNMKQWSFGTVATYEGERWLHSLNLSSTYTSQDDVDPTERTTATIQTARLFEGRWFYSGLLQYQRDQELDLDHRGSFGGGAGRWLPALEPPRAERAGRRAARARALRG